MMVLTVDDSYDGVHAKDGLGTIRVRIHRVTVTGPWDGKLPPKSPTELKPLLMGEKATQIGEHRVG